MTPTTTLTVAELEHNAELKLDELNAARATLEELGDHATPYDKGVVTRIENEHAKLVTDLEAARAGGSSARSVGEAGPQPLADVAEDRYNRLMRRARKRTTTTPEAH